MAGKTYKTCGIVLRKTKLAEKDLIITVLDESGSLLRAVAKGARKPGGSYAARLELFSIVDLMLAQGKNLDVITGATLATDAPRTTFDIEQAACASVLAELLATLAQEDLPHERLYEMSKSAFTIIGREEPRESLSVLCSALLKALAYAGFRPSFSVCVQCGNRIEYENLGRFAPFSYTEGGPSCPNCPQPPDSASIEVESIRWAEALMLSRFDEVLAYDIDSGSALSVVQFVKQWARVHVGKNLKSADFLLSSGLF